MRIPDTPSPKLQIETTNSRLLIKSKPAALRVNVQKNGLEIESRPIKLEIDNGAFFDSIGLESISTFAAETAQAGKKAALEAAGRYSEEGTALYNGGTIGDLAYMRMQKSIDSMLIFIPEEKPGISWRDGYQKIEYKPDDISYSWDTGGVQMEYIPYSIHISVQD